MTAASPSNSLMARRRLRGVLLGGSAFCAVSLPAAVHAAPLSMPTQSSTGSNLGTASGTLHAVTNLSPTTAVNVPFTVVTNGTTTTTTTVNLPAASTTLINWTTFDVGQGSTLIYNFGLSKTDTVINRVMSGTESATSPYSITIETGGSVVGQYNGTTGVGNIWFLAQDGVFIHGSVTAAGLVASNNVGLADTTLLGSPNPTILASAGGLIDLTGVSTASGASVGANGDIVLVGTTTVMAAGGSVTLSTPGTLDVTGAGVTVPMDYTVTAATFSDFALEPTFSPGRDVSITALGSFTTPFALSAPRNLSITAQGGSLTVANPLTGGTGGSGNVTLATAYGGAGDTSGDALTINAPLAATASGTSGGVLTLSSAGAISQAATGAGLTAATLTGSAGSATPAIVGVVTLTGAGNQVADLGTFTTTGAGADFAFTDAATLAVTGVVQAGSGGDGDITLTVTSPGTDLKIPGADLTAVAAGSQGGSVTLSTPGTLDVTGAGVTVPMDYTVTAATFSDFALKPIFSPGRDVSITALGSFTTPFALSAPRNLSITAQGGSLTVANPLTSGTGGSGNVTLATAYGGAGDTSGDALTINAPLAANASGGAGGMLTLTSAGAISQAATGAGLTATTLTGSAGSATPAIVGVVTLTGAGNQVADLGTFTTTGAGADFAFTDTGSLTVTGAVTAGSGTAGYGNLSLTTVHGGASDTSGDALTIDAPLTATASGTSGGVLTLVSAGSIGEQAGGTITAGTLTGSSIGSATLGTAMAPVANQVGVLGAFTAGTGFSLTDTGAGQSLTVTGTLTSTTGDIYLATTLDLDIDGSISASAGRVTFDVGQDLNLNPGGSISCNSCNGNVNYDAGRDIYIGFPISGVDIDLDAYRNLTIAAGVTATGILTTTATTGSITEQAGGLITASTLTGSSGGSTTLGTAMAPVANQVGVLGAFTAGTGFSLTDTATGQTLSVDGPLAATTGDVYLATALDLDVYGAIDAPAGLVTFSVGRDFNFNSGGSILCGACGANSGFLVSAGRDININAPLTSSAGELDAGLDINIAAAIDVTDTLTVIAGRNIAEQAGGAITAATLTGSSTGSTTLGTVASPVANLIATLGAFQAGTNFTLTNAQTLTVSGADVGSLGFTGVTAGSVAAGNLTLATLAGDIDVQTATRALTADLTTAPQTVTLVSAGNIAEQTGGAITAGTLTGSSAGSTTLGTMATPVANLIGELGSFQAGTGFSLTNAQTLTVTGADVSGLGFTGVNAGTGSATLETTAGDLDVQNSITASGAGSITLMSAGGNLTVSGAATLTEGQDLSVSAPDGEVTLVNQPIVVRDYNVTAKTLAGDFELDPDFEPGRDFTIDITATTLTTLTTNLTATRNLSVTTAGSLADASKLKAGNTVSLVADGDVTELLNGLITATTLTGSSTGSTTLGTVATPVANLIATLGAFRAGTNFSLTNAQTLTVSGADVSSLGFTGVTAGSVAAGNLTLATLGGDIDIQTATRALTADLTTAPQTVTLFSAGNIAEQNGGVITAGTLTGSSAGSTTLGTVASPVANLIGTLGSFRAGTNFSLTNDLTLTVSGADVSGLGFTGVTAGFLAAGNLTLSTLSGDIDIQTATRALTADLTTAPQTVTLVSAGNIAEQTGGVITAGTLTGSSTGSATFGTVATPVANLIGTLAAFQTGAGFSLTNAQTLAVSGADVGALGFTGVNAGAGALTLKTTAGDIDLQTATGTLTAGASTGSQVITLVSAGAIDQTGGTITGGVLTGSSGSSTTLGAIASPVANLIGTLGSFQTGAGFSLTNGQTLVVSGADASGLGFTGVNAGTGALTLATTTGDLDLQTATANLTAGASTGAQVITLVAAGNLDQAGGVITGAVLTGSSAGSATLGTVTSPVANLIGTLGAFQTGAGFSLTNAQALVVSGADVSGLGFTGVDAGTGALTLETTTGDLDLQTATGTLTAGESSGAQVITLVSAGDIDQAGGIITGGVLTGSSVGSTTLGTLASPVANVIGTLGAFQTGAGFSLTNAQTLVVSGADATGLGFTGVNAGAGALTLETTAGNLDLQTATGSLTAGTASGSQVITLVSAGAIDQGDGTITGGVVTGSSVGGASFDNANNAIGTFGGFTDTANGNVTLSDGQSLTIAGSVSIGSGQLTLISAGAIAQTAGVIQAGTLTGSSVGGTSLTDANLVGGVSDFVNATSGAITLTNAQSLAVTGTIDNASGAGVTGRDISVTLTAGSLTGTGAFDAQGDVAVLSSVGGLTLSSAAAGNDIVLRAPQGGITVTGTLVSGSGAAETGAGAQLAAAVPLTVFGATDKPLTGGAIDIGAQQVALDGAVRASGTASDIRIVATGADGGTSALALAGTLSATGDVALGASAGSVGAGGAAVPAIIAGGDVAVLAAAGSVVLSSVTAGDDIVLRAPKGSVLASGALSTSGSAAQSHGAGVALQSDLPLAFSSAQAEGPITAGGVVDVGATQVALGGAVTTRGVGADVRIVATGADSGGVALATAAITAGGDVALEASDTAATAGIATSGAVSGTNVVMVAQNGAVTLGGEVLANGGTGSPAGAGQTLFSTVSSVLDGLFALTSPSIYIEATRFQDATGALASAGGLGLDITDPNGVTLSTKAPASLPSAGSVIATALLQSTTVSVFGPATVNSGVSSLSVGSPINGSSAVATGADAELNGASPVDPVQTLKLYTKGAVTVNGKLWPATDDTVTMIIGDPAQNPAWTPSGIEIVNDGGAGPSAGSIGYAVAGATSATAYSGLQTFASVSLTTSGYIFEGQGGDLTNKTADATAFLPINVSMDPLPSYPASSINPSVPEPPVSPTNTSKAVMIAAQNLTVAVGGGLVQQNTTGVQTTSGTGFYLTGDLTIDLFGTAAPKALDLFGVFGGATSVITGPAAADTLRITFGTNVLGVLNAAPERALYRINSCVIGELGNCTPTGNPNLAIPLDQLAPIDLLSRQDLDLEDPTVTGAPNEEIWRKPETTSP